MSHQRVTGHTPVSHQSVINQSPVSHHSVITQSSLSHSANSQSSVTHQSVSNTTHRHCRLRRPAALTRPRARAIPPPLRVVFIVPAQPVATHRSSSVAVLLNVRAAQSTRHRAAPRRSCRGITTPRWTWILKRGTAELTYRATTATTSTGTTRWKLTGRS